jgi:hypothetical protein
MASQKQKTACKAFPALQAFSFPGMISGADPGQLASLARLTRRK